MNKDFNAKLAQYTQENKPVAVNILVMQELGTILVRNRKDFVALLTECGIPATESMSDAQLVELYVKHIVNQKLLLGTAFLVNMHNKTMGADGEQEVNDDGVKTCYQCLVSNFGGEENDLQDEDYANAGGAWADAVKGIAGATSKIAEGQQKKKYGAQDLMTKKQDAKTQLTQSILAQRQAQMDALAKQKEQKAKTTRTLLIVGGVVLGLAVIAGVIYAIKKRKK